MSRILATGASNATWQPGGVGGAKMPFVNLGTDSSPNYDVNTLGCNKLNPTFVQRLKDVLTDANNRGVVVQLTLFDGNPTLGTNAQYSGSGSHNPWNPKWNNMNCTDGSQLPETGAGMPYFFQIFAGNGLNCLGKIEKNYVNQVVKVVATGNTGGTSFQNVFFEVMNEAPLKTDGVWFNAADFARWHDAVAGWVKTANSNYVVSASISPGDPKALNTCTTTSCPDYSCLSSDADCGCTVGQSCPNPFGVYFKPNVNAISLHAGTWCGESTSTCTASKNPCTTAVTAKNKFARPVITSDDGNSASTLRNNAAQVKTWVSSAITCRNPGVVSFDHIDGIRMTNPPSNCSTYSDDCLDCTTIGKIGDAGPTCLNSCTGTVPSTNYCTTSY